MMCKGNWRRWQRKADRHGGYSTRRGWRQFLASLGGSEVGVCNRKRTQSALGNLFGCCESQSYLVARDFHLARMALDVHNLQVFYGSPLGEISRRMIGRILRARWVTVDGRSIAALGFGSPYLHRFRDEAARCIALMPSVQGAVIWPENDRCASALVDPDMLPLADASIDRLLIAHALETAGRPEALLNEASRIMTPEGRLILVVPSRRGIWARTDRTPFGHGLPYSKGQLRDLLHRCWLLPIFWGEALYTPPLAGTFSIRSAPTFERVGEALTLPFAGVHVVEASKQVYRPIDMRSTVRTILAPLNPSLVPSARR